jgi:sulfur carrier protein
VIELNGRPLPAGVGHTLSRILEELNVPSDGHGIAVAVDAEVIPRGEWAHFVVKDGAKLELVRAVQGG